MPVVQFSKQEHTPVDVFADCRWKVVPLSEGQLLDVRPEDIVGGGLYRVCDTYRGGGGYDRFPDICMRRTGLADMHRQFVVQLYGCHLDCPYCYVTRAGVWGEPAKVSTTRLVMDFDSTGADVFHLMGGAPAIHMTQWPELVARVMQHEDKVFHSDLLLTERAYEESILRAINHPRALYAVDVKGLTEREHMENTRKGFRESLFWHNLKLITAVGLNYYIMFTNVSEEHIDGFWYRFREILPNAYQLQKRDAFTIDLIDYKALPHVDDVPWGPAR